MRHPENIQEEIQNYCYLTISLHLVFVIDYEPTKSLISEAMITTNSRGDQVQA
jgi:hypothetical protein